MRDLKHSLESLICVAMMLGVVLQSGEASCDTAIAAHVRVTPILCCRLTRDKDRIVDILEIIKFLCRIFWKEAFQHQVDKLQTNHKVS